MYLTCIIKVTLKVTFGKNRVSVNHLRSGKWIDLLYQDKPSFAWKAMKNITYMIAISTTIFYCIIISARTTDNIFNENDNWFIFYSAFSYWNKMPLDLDGHVSTLHFKVSILVWNSFDSYPRFYYRCLSTEKTLLYDMWLK